MNGLPLVQGIVQDMLVFLFIWIILLAKIGELNKGFWQYLEL